MKMVSVLKHVCLCGERDSEKESLLTSFFIKIILKSTTVCLVFSFLLENTLMLEKPEGKRRRGWQKKRWLDKIINSMDMNLSKFWEIVEDRGAWHAAIHAVTKSWTRLSN